MEIPVANLPGTDRKIEIAPSVLPADLGNLGAECAALESAGVDRIHWDVMDGVFVPNLTFGPDMIKSCNSRVQIPSEAHLMVVEPERLMHLYYEAGCQTITVHAETCTHLHRTLGALRDLGASPAVSLNPATPASTVRHVMDLVDLVLVMTVNPGFGGQKYIGTMESKVAEIRQWVIDDGLDVDIEVDGGITPETAPLMSAAGANVFVAGSAIFKDPNGAESATASIRSAALSAR